MYVNVCVCACRLSIIRESFCNINTRRRDDMCEDFLPVNLHKTAWIIRVYTRELSSPREFVILLGSSQNGISPAQSVIQTGE